MNMEMILQGLYYVLRIDLVLGLVILVILFLIIISTKK